ncbi:MAG: hypothetical protein ACOCQQ_01525 [Candidatus Nanoarchaeia archaeon]
MAPKTRKTSQPKTKKKVWYPIHAPQIFAETLIGETYVNDSQLVQGKYVTANLSTLVRKMRKQNVNVHFRVKELTDGKAKTQVIGYSLINSAIKRMVRRGRDKITDSFLAKTKEGKILRVKPLVVTLNKGTKSMQTAIRLETRRYIREELFSKEVPQIFDDIVNGNLQKGLKKSLLIFAPLKSVDFRIVRLAENVKVKLNKEGVITQKVLVRKKDKGEEHVVESDKPVPVDENDIMAGVADGFDKGDETFGNVDQDTPSASSEEDLEAPKVDQTTSIDDEDKDLDEEEVDLIKKGEEEAQEQSNELSEEDLEDDSEDKE